MVKPILSHPLTLKIRQRLELILVMSFKSHWLQLKTSTPGHRFEDFYKARQKDRKQGDEWRSVLYVCIGIGVSLGGILLLGMPGPGLLVLAFGLALIASEFLFMAKLLDRAEIVLRRIIHQSLQWWQSLRPYQRGIGIAMAAVLLMGAAGCAYKILV